MLFVATYKIGEELVDPMLRAFLIDAGYRKEQLSLWIGSYGMVASLLGSGLGGYAAALPAAVGGDDGQHPAGLVDGGAVVPDGARSPGSLAVILATIGEHFAAAR